MSGAPKSQPVKPLKVSRADAREARLKLALKANMARRKAQARARDQAGSQDDSREEPDNDNE